MSAAVLVLAGVFGLLIGSFLNVVAYRVPAGLSVVSPPSACPGCQQLIRPRDNVPVLSWLILRGRCRGCAMPIAVRYPLVEAGTGLAFVVAALPFAGALGATGDVRAASAAGLELIAFLYLAAISVVLAVIDLDVRRLPDAIVLPGYGVGVLLLGGTALLRGDPVVLAVAAASSGVAALLFAVLWFAKPGGMGLGDVKLAGVLGLFLGFLGLPQVVVGLAAGFLLGGVFGVLLLLLGRGHRGTAIPFGPWMLLGAWIGILGGQPIAEWYLRLTGLA